MSVRTLEVKLNSILVGHLTHYPDERTLFVVDQRYVELGPTRPILSLSMARPGDEDGTQQLLQHQRFKSSSVLQRVGAADQYRDDVMTAVMAARNAVLTKWEQIFVEFDVPPHLIQKVPTHVSGLRLGSEL